MLDQGDVLGNKDFPESALLSYDEYCKQTGEAMTEAGKKKYYDDQAETYKKWADGYNESVEAMTVYSSALSTSSAGLDMIQSIINLAKCTGTASEKAALGFDIAKQFADIGGQIFDLAVKNSGEHDKALQTAYSEGNGYTRPDMDKQTNKDYKIGYDIARQSIALGSGVFDFANALTVLVELKGYATKTQIAPQATSDTNQLGQGHLDGITGDTDLSTKVSASDLNYAEKAAVNMQQAQNIGALIGSITGSVANISSIVLSYANGDADSAMDAIDDLSQSIQSVVQYSIQISDCTDDFVSNMNLSREKLRNSAEREALGLGKDDPKTENELKTEAKETNAQNEAYNKKMIIEASVQLAAELAKGGTLISRISGGDAEAEDKIALAACVVKAGGYITTIAGAGVNLSALGNAQEGATAPVDLSGGSMAVGVGRIICGSTDILQGIYGAFKATGNNDPAAVTSSIATVVSGAMSIVNAVFVNIKGEEDNASAGMSSAITHTLNLVFDIISQFQRSSSTTTREKLLLAGKDVGEVLSVASDISSAVNLFKTDAVSGEVIGGLKIAAAGTKLATQIASYFTASKSKEGDERALLLASLQENGVTIVTESLKLAKVASSAPVGALVATGVDMFQRGWNIAGAIKRSKDLQRSCGNVRVRNLVQMHELADKYDKLHKDETGAEKRFTKREEVFGDKILTAEQSRAWEEYISHPNPIQSPHHEEFKRIAKQTFGKEKMRTEVSGFDAGMQSQKQTGYEEGGHLAADVGKVVADCLLPPFISNLVKWGIDIARSIGHAVAQKIRENTFDKKSVKKHFDFDSLYSKIPPKMFEKDGFDKDKFVLEEMLHFRKFEDCANMLRRYVGAQLYAQTINFESKRGDRDVCATALAVLASLKILDVKKTTPIQIAEMLGSSLST